MIREFDLVLVVRSRQHPDKSIPIARAGMGMNTREGDYPADLAAEVLESMREVLASPEAVEHLQRALRDAMQSDLYYEHDLRRGS